MKNFYTKFFTLVFAAFIFVNTAVTANASYDHDPMMNPKTAEDIVENPEAVYGYSPNPNSKRLGSYADMAWTDKATVEAGRQSRIEYYNDMKSLMDLANSLMAKGESTEKIARAVSAKRNEIRIASYKNDPDGLARLYESNLATYGNKEGPTADSLYKKYGSWTTVLQKAFSVNSGMDACLGLYDEHYQLYKVVGEVKTFTGIVGNTKVRDINKTSASEITECIMNNVLCAMKYDSKTAIDLGKWNCLNLTMAEILKMKDSATTFVWSYNGGRYCVTVPAGADISQYMENNSVGMMKLFDVYQGSELHNGDELYPENPCYMP